MGLTHSQGLIKLMKSPIKLMALLSKLMTGLIKLMTSPIKMMTLLSKLMALLSKLMTLPIKLMTSLIKLMTTVFSRGRQPLAALALRRATRGIDFSARVFARRMTTVP